MKKLFAIAIAVCACALSAFASPPNFSPNTDLQAFSKHVDSLNVQTAAPPAQTNFSAAGFFTYDFKTHAGQANAVILDKLTDFTHVLGGDHSIEFDAFTGVTISNKPSGISGFALGKTFRLADQVNAYAGGAVAIQAGAPVQFGIVAGIQVKFRRTLPSISTLASMHRLRRRL